jgi:hypothetical protein
MNNEKGEEMNKTPTPTEEKYIKLSNELGSYCFKKISKEVRKDKDMDFKEALLYLTGMIIENNIRINIIDASIEDHIPYEEMQNIVNDATVIFDQHIARGLKSGLEYLKFMDEGIKAMCNFDPCKEKCEDELKVEIEIERRFLGLNNK